ncbi:hypothetical protein A4E84_33470 [Streptomyces qaidamensis]|uniref:Phosphatidic acid phosphatase type 2/haloperoxidase domain-containing protein n=1 Tax=Streptomyces qaidamensis TaxID=1783515 RepID=A0A143C986_9ACTN|nr:hypothetical protein A4E84_33470 [Streptomyces qaidamensis]
MRPGSTARGRPLRRATRAAVFTVPSPPHTPSTRARPAASSSRTDTSPGAHSTTSAPGRASAQGTGPVGGARGAVRDEDEPFAPQQRRGVGLRAGGGVTWPRAGTRPRTANAAPATGVALESQAWGAVVAPVAASVALSRVYTGVHHPSDVLAGAGPGRGAGARAGALGAPDRRPAGVLAALRVLRTGRYPPEAESQGRTRPVWLLFAGNGTCHRVGQASGRRRDLADGQLDVRVVHGGRRPAARLPAAALAGSLAGH